MKTFYKVWLHSTTDDTHTETFKTKGEALTAYYKWELDLKDNESLELSEHKSKDDYEGITIK